MNLQGMEFVYESHLVKDKATGAQKVENPYYCHVKHRFAITPVL